eukprot:4979072-Prymnesium_polylepis.1
MEAIASRPHWAHRSTSFGAPAPPILIATPTSETACASARCSATIAWVAADRTQRHGHVRAATWSRSPGRRCVHSLSRGWSPVHGS